MKKIVDTYSNSIKPITGGRCQRWWESNMNNLNSAKNKKHREEDAELDIHKFLNEFNLKGVEFGNWLQQGERYDHLLAAGYALYELSKLVGKNIGFDYNVGIAFGARGMRGAAAHFEPLANMINLTKMKGHGTLAHEYGHVLDYNIGAYLDQNKLYSYLSGGRSVSNQLPGNTGKELRAMVNQIVDYVKTTDSYKKLFKGTPGSPYWHRRTEVFARFFEQYVAYKTKSSNSYLCRRFDWYTTSMSKIAYLQEDEFMQILPVADKLVARIKDYVSEDGLPLKAMPYPAAIIYKHKGQAKQESKAASTKQPQDTKATKNKATSSVKTKAKINLYDYVGKDTRRPIFTGVYHDPKGYAVATDCHIMVVDKELFNPQLSGKVIGKKGEDLTDKGKYPNWQLVVNKYKKVKAIKFDADDIIKFIKGKNLSPKGLKTKQIRLYSNRDYSYRADMLLLFCKALKRFNCKVYLTDQCNLFCKNENGYLCLVPIVYDSTTSFDYNI